MANESIFGIPNGDIPAQGNTIILNPSPFLPSPGFGTVDDNIAMFYRVGDRLVGRVQFHVDVVAASPVYISMPAGLTINRGLFSRMHTLTADSGTAERTFKLGHWLRMSPPAGGQISSYSVAGNAGVLYFDNVDPSKLYFSYISTDGAWTAQTVQGIFTNGDMVELDFDIPIAEWSI